VYGGGLDRYSGAASVAPTSFRSLVNVHLRNGAAEARKGITPVSELVDAGGNVMSHVLLIHALRTEASGVVVGYRESVRELHVFATAGDGSKANHVGLWGTLPAGGDFPAVRATEVNGRLILAHAEPAITRRVATYVYDPAATPELQSLTADLNGAGLEPVKYFGVEAYLDYLVGWGFGHATEQRPELLRISLPGEHLVFEADWYAIIGVRGDPLVTCIRAGGEFLAFKEHEIHKLTGYDASTFGSRIIDTEHGAAGPRLAIEAEGRGYFWSGSTGPRITTGAASEDLGLPLDLEGPTPSELVDADLIPSGFVFHDREKREVVWVFGRWGYALSLGEDRPRWSFREYGFRPGCAGLLYSRAGGASGAPAGHPEFDSVASAAAAQLNITITHVGSDGNEIIEPWVRPAGGAWTEKANVNVNGLATQVVTIAGLASGTLYDVAFRYRRGGLFVDAYASADPSTWPGVSAGQGTTTLAGANAPTTAWSRTGADAEQIALSFASVDPAAAIRVSRAEVVAGVAGAYTLLTDPDLVAGTATHTDSWAAADARGEKLWRYKVELTRPGASLTAYADRWAGPDGPAGVAHDVVDYYSYTLTWTAPGANTTTTVQDDYLCVATFASRGTTAAAATTKVCGVEKESLLSQDGSEVEFPLNARLRHNVTAFGVVDSSAWVDFGEVGVLIHLDETAYHSCP